MVKVQPESIKCYLLPSPKVNFKYWPYSWWSLVCYSQLQDQLRSLDFLLFALAISHPVLFSVSSATLGS